MPKHQIVMGVSVAVLSLVGLWQSNWLLANTGKGEWIRRRYGEPKARTIVRTFFFAAAVFGALLALDVIRPLQW